MEQVLLDLDRIRQRAKGLTRGLEHSACVDCAPAAPASVSANPEPEQTFSSVQFRSVTPSRLSRSYTGASPTRSFEGSSSTSIKDLLPRTFQKAAAASGPLSRPVLRAVTPSCMRDVSPPRDAARESPRASPPVPAAREISAHVAELEARARPGGAVDKGELDETRREIRELREFVARALPDAREPSAAEPRAGAKEELAAAREENRELRARLEDAEAELARRRSLEDEVARLQAELGRAEAALEEKREVITSLRSRVAELRSPAPPERIDLSVQDLSRAQRLTPVRAGRPQDMWSRTEREIAALNSRINGFAEYLSRQSAEFYSPQPRARTPPRAARR
eukprot:gnl/Chilomastix_cuspidata/2986.p1 GENE.gnl/Chilomastix_cuspidata/2986~~gnl/Chilomastix_cuspidata/2986.p1  ORF type:complete len:339 (-),score=97.53 gnl/Chilomastix_cuspidata/2986:113-1129(-)